MPVASDGAWSATFVISPFVGYLATLQPSKSGPEPSGLVAPLGRHLATGGGHREQPTADEPKKHAFIHCHGSSRGWVVDAVLDS